MQALVYEGAWQMPLRQVETPQVQSPDDVVVAVKAVGVCGSDVHGFRGTTGRRKSPVIMGHDFTGTTKAVGSNVSDKQVGDRVVVNPILACGKCDDCLAGLPKICLDHSGLGVNLNGALRMPCARIKRWSTACQALVRNGGHVTWIGNSDPEV